MQSLLELYQLSNLVPEIAYGKAKLLLSIYRQMSWFSTVQANEQIQELKELAVGELDASLVYLINFAPKEKREQVQDNLLRLFQNRTMLRLFEDALDEIATFPERGEEYREILVKTYMEKSKYTESIILEALKMERSTYYDRKKEAVYAFGLALWGKIIPRIVNKA